MNPINWEDSWRKQLSLVSDEEVISLSHAKVYVFSDSVLCFGKVNPASRIKYCLGTTVGLVQRFTTIQNFGHNWRRTDGIWGNISQDSPHCSSAMQSKSSCLKWAINQNYVKDGSSSCRSMTSYGDLKTMKQECKSNANLVSIYATRKMVIPRTWIRKEVVCYSW